jgi:amino acid permease
MNNLILKNYKENKLIYIGVFAFVVIRICTPYSLTEFDHNSLIYKFNFFIIGLNYWFITVLFLLIGYNTFKKGGKLNSLIAFVLCLLGLCFFIFPFYIYYEIYKLDQALIIIHKKLESFKK